MNVIGVMGTFGIGEQSQSWRLRRLIFQMTVMPVLIALCAGLIPCPDCGRDVSRRALMCPNCGLKGEVIAEIAKAIPEVAAGNVLDVDCGTCAAHAQPVEMSDNIW